MGEPPLILAGPILRRVEPRLVCVWLALSEPRTVLLSVYEDRVQAGTGAGPFDGGTPKVTGVANTLRVGQRLHIGVAVAQVPPADTPLLPGRNYSYNVTLGPVRADDLRSLGLLVDGTVDGRPHKALGYEPGELPGFALSPADPTQLRILHGSCRRPHFIYKGDEGSGTYDGMAWVDDLILRWRRGVPGETPFDANVRPHQLFLTGDQIYADDVASPLLPMLNREGGRLLGRVETLRTRYPPKNTDPDKELYLGVPKQPGFATLDAYFTEMNKRKRNPFEALQDDRRVRAMADPCLFLRYLLLYKRVFEVDPSVEEETDDQGLRLWPGDLLHFPAALRRQVLASETRLTTSGLADHLVTFGEFCSMYLASFSPAGWALRDGAPALATIDEVYRLPPEILPQIWDLHACFDLDHDKCFERTDITGIEAYFAEQRADEERIRAFRRATASLTSFYESLPRVRRALANIPTYMVWDDHDVTDDWNLTRAWRDQVHTKPLGMRIITNAMIAYALFQDWGNDPLRYRTGPFRDLLDAISGLYPEGLGLVPEAGRMDALARLLGLNRPNPEEPAPPLLKWHFSVDGARHRVIVLDTRTRRSFASRHVPSGLLSPAALNDQIPDPVTSPLPTGIDLLVVVSQTSVVLPALASSLFIPLMTRKNEWSDHSKWRNLEGLSPDAEIWPGDDRAYDLLLRRLAMFGQVIVLSGEIHHGFAGRLSLWGKGARRFTLAAGLRADLGGPAVTTGVAAAFQTAGFPLSAQACLAQRPGNGEWQVIDPGSRTMFLIRDEDDGLVVYSEDRPATIVQFTSSGLKNVVPELAKIGPNLGFGFALIDLTPAERLIWTDSTPAPLRPPEGRRFPPAVRTRVSGEPVLVPSGNWPAGTSMTRRPDFAWRSELVRDERPDDGPDPRPEFARAGVIPAFDPAGLVDSYRRIARAHAEVAPRLRFGRGALLRNNVGLVRLVREGADLVAIQDLYSHDAGRDEPVRVNSYRIPLRDFGEERPMLRFDVPDEG